MADKFSLQYGARTGTFYVLKNADELGGEIVYTSSSRLECLIYIKKHTAQELHFWKARVSIPSIRMIASVELPGERTFEEAQSTFGLLENSGCCVLEIVRADV